MKISPKRTRPTDAHVSLAWDVKITIVIPYLCKRMSRRVVSLTWALQRSGELWLTAGNGQRHLAYQCRQHPSGCALGQWAQSRDGKTPERWPWPRKARWFGPSPGMCTLTRAAQAACLVTERPQDVHRLLRLAKHVPSQRSVSLGHIYLDFWWSIEASEAQPRQSLNSHPDGHLSTHTH